MPVPGCPAAGAVLPSPGCDCPTSPSRRTAGSTHGGSGENPPSSPQQWTNSAELAPCGYQPRSGELPHMNLQGFRSDNAIPRGPLGFWGGGWICRPAPPEGAFWQSRAGTSRAPRAIPAVEDGQLLPKLPVQVFKHRLGFVELLLSLRRGKGGPWGSRHDARPRRPPRAGLPRQPQPWRFWPRPSFWRSAGLRGGAGRCRSPPACGPAWRCAPAGGHRGLSREPAACRAMPPPAGVP